MSGILSVGSLLALGACSNSANTQPKFLRVMLDQPPVTLNPRESIDATGQRLIALIFRGLTRIDANLEAQPDLAEKWTVEDSGRTWKFKIRTSLNDHADQPISASRIVQCLENYRTGSPVSPLRAGFPTWIATEANGKEVIIRLKDPDPYLARNISALRYFTVSGEKSAPCTSPGERALIGSGRFRPVTWTSAPEDEITLVPSAPEKDPQPVQFLFIRDSTTAALKLARGEVDAMFNMLSPTKLQWLRENYSDQFDFIDRAGVRVSYLAFNLRDPILSRREVRQAIAQTISKGTIINHKLPGSASPAGSLLAPLLPESHQVKIDYHPASAEKILDQAGFPRKKDGIRMALHYKTTPIREGYEAALIFKNMLRKIGIDLVIDVIEPAVFLASIRKGSFQMYSSRWLGIADGSILYRTLRSGQPNNRGGYRNAEMDRLLDQAIIEPMEKKRIPILRKVQELAGKDLPFVPLWYWSNTLVVRKGWTGLAPEDLSLSGALEPLTHLRYR